MGVDENLKSMYTSAYYEEKKALDNFLLRYEFDFGRKPKEKIIKQYCKVKNIEYPMLSLDEYVLKRIDIWNTWRRRELLKPDKDKELIDRYTKGYYDEKKALENYILHYETEFGKMPSDEMIKQYCEFRGSYYPIGTIDEYVAKHLDEWKNLND